MRMAFAGKTFWIKAEITDVKKQPDKRWCFLKFIEKNGNIITTEMKAVFWANTYSAIENFETNTQQIFASGLEITCCVRVRFHKRYGLDLEVLDID
ncbi:MAG: exodeoxyribonuclease VII large subunit [Bacteroidetes bacterium]|nr:exodeoxyribonuclease VII large subunit [Bacteroidota bacterium]